MSVYLTPSDIKSRIEQDIEDFEDPPNPDTEFDELLETLEKETRAIIESYKGDVTFSEETRTDKKIAPDKSSLELLFPVQEVSKVEYRADPGSDWETLDSDYYSVYPRKVVLRRSYGRFENRPYRTRNPWSMRQKRRSWANFCTEVQITYTRGYDPVPANVLNIQLSMINKALRQLRNEQNITSLQPEEVNNFVNFDELLTEDLERRLNSMTSFRNQLQTA